MASSSLCASSAVEKEKDKLLCLLERCARARCLVCSRDLGGASTPDTLCSDHASATGDLKFLVDVCLELVEELKQILLPEFGPRYWQTVEADLARKLVAQEGRDWKVPAGIRQKQRAARCLVMTEACEVSQKALPDLIQQKMLDPPNSCVEAVFEVLYGAHAVDGVGWWHAAFLVEQKNGDLWAFDPTGMQFGPDWPVLQRWDPYARRRMESGRPEFVRRLGDRRAMEYPPRPLFVDGEAVGHDYAEHGLRA